MAVHNSSAWDTEWLEAVVGWATRHLGCAGEYLVAFVGPIRRRGKQAVGRCLVAGRQRLVTVRVDPGIAARHGRLPQPDPRLPELREWTLAQPEFTGCAASTEYLVFVLGHELWHAEDERTSGKRVDPVADRSGFVAMEQRCDAAGYALVAAWRAGGEEWCAVRVGELRRSRATAARAAARMGQGRLGSLADARAALEQMRDELG